MAAKYRDPSVKAKKKGKLIMKIIREKQLASAKEMKVGDVVVVRFDSYSQYRSFSVQLSGYNARFGREKNQFIHAACDLNGFQYCLVAISGDEYAREKSDSAFRNNWKKNVPAGWKNA